MSETSPRDDGVLRITREEALGSHAEDLIVRQKGMRGEAKGLTRGKRAWYYQNWLIFMVVGAAAAFAAWCIIEPYFDDIPYAQGPITKLQSASSLPQGLTLLSSDFGPVSHCLTIQKQEVYLTRDFFISTPEGWKRTSDVEGLTVGREVRIYGQHAEEKGLGMDFMLGMFVDPSPQSFGAAKIPTLSQQQTRQTVCSLFLFALVAAFVGLAIGAADGIVCRLPRRAFLAGGVGMIVGFIGGLLCLIPAGLIYGPISQWAGSQGGMSGWGFLLQVMGRGLAWMVAGMGMGLGQGLALRSKRLALYGFLGGVIGGLLGGLCFDPVDFVLLEPYKPSAHVSRLVGVVMVGACVGLMIGLVELLARDAWLRMIEGPLAGKEFILFRDSMRIGAAPNSDIYLFNDPEVAQHHADLRLLGDDCEIEVSDSILALEHNGNAVRRARLRHGDRITIGRTSFIFEKRGS